MTDCVEVSTQNVFWPQTYFCAKRASKMLLSFSIGTFLTNYDDVNRNLKTSSFSLLYKNEQFESKNNPIETT